MATSTVATPASLWYPGESPRAGPGIHVLNNRKLVGVLLIHDIARLVLETQLAHDPAAARRPAKRRQSTLVRAPASFSPPPLAPDARRPQDQTDGTPLDAEALATHVP